MHKVHMQQTKNLAENFLPASFTKLDFLSSHSLFSNLNPAVGSYLTLFKKKSVFVN